MNPLPNGFRERIREFFRRRGRRRPVHAYWRSASASSESLTSNAERDTSRLRQRRDRVESFLKSNSCPLVRYLPAPVSSAGLNVAPTPEWLARWVPSDLPSICIESYNASCTICLMDFEEPKPISAFKWRILSPTRMAGSPEPLRQLRCRHVFHQFCIDELVRQELTAAGCPVCRKKVLGS